MNLCQIYDIIRQIQMVNGLLIGFSSVIDLIFIIGYLSVNKRYESTRIVDNHTQMLQYEPVRFISIFIK